MQEQEPAGLGITDQGTLATDASFRRVAVAAALVAAAGVSSTSGGPATLAVAGVAFLATAASGVLSARSELIRRSSGAHALERCQAVRMFRLRGERHDAVAAVEVELVRSGFVVERVEAAHEAQVVLATRNGWAFTGSMLVHAGLMTFVAALAIGPLERTSGVAALGCAAVLGGAWLRLVHDRVVVWCAVGAGETGNAVELVVSGRWLASRVTRWADHLVSRLSL